MTVTFLSPYAALVGLVAVLGLWTLVAVERRSRRLCAAIGLAPKSALSAAAPAAALVLTGALLALAAAQPVVATVSPGRARADAEVLFVFDISRSMAARAKADGPTRLERARALAKDLRGSIPEVPVGIASLTDRVLPHLFPTADGEAFVATLDRSLGIERPPPDRGGARGRATALGALEALGTRNFFGARSRHRVAVVFTDGESSPIDTRTLDIRLRQGSVTTIFVHVWGSDERIYAAGQPIRAYEPDPSSRPALRELANALEGQAFAEDDLESIAAALRAAVGRGPLRPQGRRLDARELSSFAVAAAALPLLFLVWRRNLPPNR